MVAVAIGGAALIGGATTLIAGGSAAHAQEQSSQAQIAEARREYDQSRADYAPYRQLGYGAIGQLAGLYGINGAPRIDPTATLRATPGYQFQLDQGVQASERSASARGLLGSGAAQKALVRFGQGLADQTYGQYLNELNSMAGIGQTATNSTTAAGQAASSQIGSAYQNEGNARASSYANTASAINGTVSNLASAYLYSQNGGYGGGGSSPTTMSDVYRGVESWGH